MDSELCGTYDVYLADKPAGSLTVSREGLTYSFRALCRTDSPVVFHLYCGEADRTVSVGVPVPEGNALVLRRSFSGRALEDMGLRRIDRCFLSPCTGAPLQASFSPSAKTESDPPAENSWRSVRDISLLFLDPDLRKACAVIQSGFLREEDGCVYAAIPISPDQPFPLMPVFCFGSSGFLNGKEYLIFRTRDGELCTDE